MDPSGEVVERELAFGVTIVRGEAIENRVA